MAFNGFKLKTEQLEQIIGDHDKENDLYYAVRELLYYRERYEFEENQSLCVGCNGRCDGDLVGAIHETHCPSFEKDIAKLRPDLYNEKTFQEALKENGFEPVKGIRLDHD